jgi:hypothetical protein
MLEPNSAPDSFAPSHCKAPDFGVLVAAAALLDEDLWADNVEETIMSVGDVGSGTVVEEVFIELAVVDKSLRAEEGVRAGTVGEACCVVEYTALDVEVGIRAVEGTNMLLECVA